MKKSIQKTKNSQNNNLYQSTESIIKIIIDKLIYLSIRKSYSNKIDSQLQDYCFNYMKNNINNMFEPYYISHTLDSKKPINNNENNEKKDELFWKLKKPQNNTWVEILEPQYFEIDRYEGTNIKYKEIKDDDIGSVGRKKIQNIPEMKNANKKSHFIYNKNNNDTIKAIKEWCKNNSRVCKIVNCLTLDPEAINGIVVSIIFGIVVMIVVGILGIVVGILGKVVGILRMVLGIFGIVLGIFGIVLGIFGNVEGIFGIVEGILGAIVTFIVGGITQFPLSNV